MRVKLFGAMGIALAVACVAHAQSVQVISVGPGVALVVPAQAAPAMLPEPVAMMQQMDAMMQAQLQQAAAMQGAMPVASGSYSSVVVTSFSDGQHSCTERVVYPGNGAAAQVQVSQTGNACASLGVQDAQPASAPVRAVPIPTSSPAIQKPSPLVIADNN